MDKQKDKSSKGIVEGELKNRRKIKACQLCGQVFGLI
jgi:hypothetical protein